MGPNKQIWSYIHVLPNAMYPGTINHCHVITSASRVCWIIFHCYQIPYTHRIIFYGPFKLICNQNFLWFLLHTAMRQWTQQSLVHVKDCRLFGTKPLTKSTLVYCPLDALEQTSKYKTFHSRKCIWRYRLRGHFVRGGGGGGGGGGGDESIKHSYLIMGSSRVDIFHCSGLFCTVTRFHIPNNMNIYGLFKLICNQNFLWSILHTDLGKPLYNQLIPL